MPHATKEGRDAYMAATRERRTARESARWAAMLNAETPESREVRLVKERERICRRYIRNKVSILESNAKYRAEHAEKRRETVRRSAAKHSEKKKAYAAKYHAENKERIKAYSISRRHIRAAQERQRKESDENYRIKATLRSRMAAAIRKVKGVKAYKTDALVGCGIVLLRAYLQSLFRPGMTWQNYGEWHVDHIVPCAEFDLRDSEQQKKCFHFSNLQPLWGIDNLRKGAKTRPLAVSE